MDGVEEFFMKNLEAQAFQSCGQDLGQAMNPACDRLQTLRAVVDCIHACHDREENLCGADVGGGFLTADVLLASLERHPQGRAALRVDGDADDSSRHQPLVQIPRRKICGMRAPVSERDSEPLRVPDRSVRAELTRRLEKREAQEVCCDGYKRPGFVGALAERSVVINRAVGGGVLEEGAEYRFG